MSFAPIFRKNIPRKPILCRQVLKKKLFQEMYRFYRGLNYKTLIILLVTFSLLNPTITTIVLKVGCLELDNFLLMRGLGVWIFFRIVLLSYLIGIFVLGYWFCKKYSTSKILIMIKITLFVINVYMCSRFFRVFSIFSKIFWGQIED